LKVKSQRSPSSPNATPDRALLHGRQTTRSCTAARPERCWTWHPGSHQPEPGLGGRPPFRPFSIRASTRLSTCSSSRFSSELTVNSGSFSPPRYSGSAYTRPFLGMVATAPAAMKGELFDLINPRKLLTGENYDVGQVTAPPGTGVVHDGSSRFLTIWNPDRPKRLKPAHLKKSCRDLNFVTAVAKQFGSGSLIAWTARRG
jgi:hypothetical protein